MDSEQQYNNKVRISTASKTTASDFPSICGGQIIRYQYAFTPLLVVLLGFVSLLCVSFQVAAEDKPARKVVFGMDRAYPPFEWLEAGQPTGFFIDLQKALGKVGNAEIVHFDGDWATVVNALDVTEIDVVPMLLSPEREERFRFSRPFHFMAHAIYTRPGNEPSVSIDTLTGRVAIEGASYAYEQLTRMPNPDIQLIETGNTQEALGVLLSGGAEYAVLTIPAAESLIRQHSLTLEREGLPFWSVGYAFAVKKGSSELIAWLDSSMDKLLDSGLYEQVYNRWKPQLEPVGGNWEAILRTTTMVATPLAAIALLAFVWLLSLRRTVAVRTRELSNELLLRRETEAKLQHLVNFDTESGLSKYRHFIENLDALLDRDEDKVATAGEVVVLKLTDMEALAHTFGDTITQQVIRELADRLKTLDFHLTAYFGRGVYAVAGRRGYVQQVMEVISAQLSSDCLGLYPRVIYGAADWPEHGRKAKDLVKLAETALASGLARNRQWSNYHGSMEPDQMDIHLVTAFRASQGSGLYAVFQPQVDLRSKRVVGAEALVRWMHPDYGPIAPNRFIPLLEKAGLVTQITELMLDQSIAMASELRQAGWHCPISINVTASDLSRQDFLLTLIQSTLTQYDMPAECLKLELTESTLIEEPQQVRLYLEELDRMGIITAIDDFGTGYSSLSYLREMPLREIKLDRSFICNLVNSQYDQCLVRSVIEMAHGLGLTVIAEGAEDEATLQSLRKKGCDRVQGYVISKPLPGEEFKTFVERFEA